MKLSVIVTVVKDPTGRTQPNGDLFDVFKLEAFYTNIDDNIPPSMAGWQDNNSKLGITNKYIAYADNLTDLYSYIYSLNINYWTFPSSSNSNTETSANIGG